MPYMRYLRAFAPLREPVLSVFIGDRSAQQPYKMISCIFNVMLYRHHRAWAGDPATNRTVMETGDVR